MDAPAAPAPSVVSDRRDLLVLAAAVLAFNLPYFRDGFLPGHDAKYVFGIFSYFYNNAVVEHELPRWMSFGAFGIKGAGFQFYFLTPSSYLCMLGGLLVGVRDALSVFTLSIVGEQLVFLLGIHLLVRRLYADRLTSLLISFSAVCGVVWTWQLFFNFRLFYLVPLELFFLFRFAGDRKPEDFWAAVLALLLGVPGCPPYFYPLHALVFLSACLGLGSAFWTALPALRSRSPRNLIVFGLCALTAAAVGLTLHEALDGIKLVAPERDPSSGRVTLQTFLTYGGTAGPALLPTFLGALPSPGSGVDHELTHFIGLLPLAGLPVALLRCRSPYFRSLMLAAGILLLLSLGGTFAALVFRLPLMGLYRHVGLVTPLAKLLLLLASGFGVETILSAPGAGVAWDRRTRFAALGGLLLVSWLLLDLQFGGGRLVSVIASAATGDFQYGGVNAAMAAVLRLAGYLAASAVLLWPSRSVPLGAACSPLAARKALAGALVLDGLLFQAIVIAGMPRTTDTIPFAAGDFPWHERRNVVFDAATDDRLRQWRVSGIDGAEYHIAICAAFRLDPGAAVARQDWSSRPVTELKDARSGIVPDPLLPSILGITAPKLRVFSSAAYADTPADALRLLSRPDLPGSQAVLEGVAPERRFTRTGPGEPRAAIKVKEFSANRLVLQVDLADDGPVWLSYADSFHPGWSATVNGTPEPVAKSFHAFKAVRLEKGTSEVRFRFHDGLHTFASQLLALLATLFAAAAAAAFALPLRRGKAAHSS